jgi:dephospho-CoA kinase
VNKIKENFGESVVKNRTVDRQQLRELVYNDEVKRQMLNNLLHPEILKLMDDIVDHALSEYLFMEIPLLFETHLEKCLDFIVLVAVDEKTQLQRLMHRNNYQETEALKIIKTQMPLSEKVKRADLLIENNNTEIELQNHVWNIIKYLSRIKRRNIKRFSDAI